MIEPSQRWRTLLTCVCLAIVTAAVYLPVRHFEFTNYDDGDYVYDNAQVQEGLTPQGLVWAFTTNHSSNWHPLTWLSHMLDWQLWGGNAGAHHLVNVLLHLANTLLLFSVLRRMTAAPWRSGFVAAVFALHPLHVQSVAWVAERKDVLSASLWMLTMWAYVRYVKQPNRTRYWLAVGLYALGLMAKPMVVTLPFVLLLIDYWPLGRTRWAKPACGVSTELSLSWLLREKLPFLVLAAASCIATVWAQHSGETIAPLEVVGVGSRMANGIVSYVLYLGKTFWPTDLAVFYPYKIWPLSTVLLAGVALLGVSGVLAWRARREPYLTMGWLWYLGTLVPVIGLAQVGAHSMADRYTYIPMIGLTIVAAWGLPRGAIDRRLPKLTMTAVACVLLIACAVVSRLQVHYWKDTETLFRHALEVTTDNWLAHNNLAIALLKRGQTSEAIRHLQEAMLIRPNSAAAHRNLGNAQFRAGNIQEAIERCGEAIRLEPDYAEAHYDLGCIWQSQCERARAQVCFENALVVRPNYAEAHHNLAGILAEGGRLAEAIEHYRQALTAAPDLGQTHFNLGLKLAEMKHNTEAIEHLRAAKRLLPAVPDTYIQLAKALVQDGHFAEAIATLQSGLSTNSPNPAIANEYAWLLVTCPVAELRNAPQAIQIGEELVKVTARRSPQPLDTLGAAYADAGRFDEAVAAAQKAIDLARTAGQVQLVRDIELRLLLYRDGRAYRQSVEVTSPHDP